MKENACKKAVEAYKNALEIIRKTTRLATTWPLQKNALKKKKVEAAMTKRKKTTKNKKTRKTQENKENKEDQENKENKERR